MKDILIVAHFTLTPDEPGNDRFDYLAKLLAARGAKVELVTTAFSHPNKAPRPSVDTLQPLLPYTLTMLSEPPYQKNVSLRRIRSHRIFGQNLRRYLATRRPPDVLYCGVPTLDAADISAAYAKKHHVPFVIDIQDVWPDAFSMALPIPALGKLLFFPWQNKADRVYRAADEIVAVSETYAARAMRVNRKCKQATAVYLGADMDAIDAYARENRIVRNDDDVVLAYVGTLGVSYDIKTVIDALLLCRKKGAENLRFIVMGYGPQREVYEKYATDRQAPVEFTGMLPYPVMIGRLSAADIAVNPITAGSPGSVINKVCDYAATGLPVVNTQLSPEYRKLLSRYNAGISCVCEDAESTSRTIMQLCEDVAARRAMAENSRKMAEECFDRKRTYQQIVELLLRLSR